MKEKVHYDLSTPLVIIFIMCNNLTSNQMLCRNYRVRFLIVCNNHAINRQRNYGSKKLIKIYI